MRSAVRRGFTLVEILIVVVILGILAAIVIPQFTSATIDAQGGNLAAQIQTLQGQIDIYKGQHANQHPFAGANWDLLVTNGYIKAAPQNPAFPGAAAAKCTISTATSGTGSATTAWLYRTDAAAGGTTLYASYFDERTFTVTTNATD